MPAPTEKIFKKNITSASLIPSVKPSPASVLKNKRHSEHVPSGITSSAPVRIKNIDPIQEDKDAGDDEQIDERREVDPSPEYWLIQKLIKYLRIGNPTATIISIISLRDCDLLNESNQLAIRNLGALDILINLLETEDLRSIRASLLVLKDVSMNVLVRETLFRMNAVKSLIKLLDEDHEEIQSNAAQTLSNCCKNANNRKIVRTFGGIEKLANLLKISKSDSVVQSASDCLWRLAKNSINKTLIFGAGVFSYLYKLLNASSNENVLTPLTGLLQECAGEEEFRSVIIEQNLIEPLCQKLKMFSKCEDLVTLISIALFKCGIEKKTCEIFAKNDGVSSLLQILDSYLKSPNKKLLSSVVGAIWKTCQLEINSEQYIKLGAVRKIVQILDEQQQQVNVSAAQQEISETLLMNAVGALGTFARVQVGRQAIKEANGVYPLVQLLTRTDPNLLVNASSSIGALCKDPDCLNYIVDKMDGLRLLWSLLKSNNPKVQASSAWAISSCIEKSAGELVRSFVGGLELLVALLKSEDEEVLAGVCAAVSKIALDEENLAVITDNGAIQLLASLANTKYDPLRETLSEAIANCCQFPNNRQLFGKAGAVAPLVKFLKSDNTNVHRGTVLAMAKLSLNSDNCICLHESGCVPLLLEMVGSTDSVIQEAAAATLHNVRKLALSNDK